jgi:hypothetical protein
MFYLVFSNDAFPLKMLLCHVFDNCAAKGQMPMGIGLVDKMARGKQSTWHKLYGGVN